MPDGAENNKQMDKSDYKEAVNALEKRLAMLQQTVRDEQIPVLIVFEGWGASGKGTYIGRVVYPLDPRYFNVYTMDKVTEDMAMRPFLWPYWIKTPAKGRITIFDKSWHRIVLPDTRDKWRLSETAAAHFYNDVNAFERQLTDDGALIIKLFLNISQDEQRKRFKDLEKNPDTAWRVDANDWAQNRGYEQYEKYFEKMLKMTDTRDNPWHIIEANDKRRATVRIYTTIAESIERRVAGGKTEAAAAPPPAAFAGPRVLRETPLDKQVGDEAYKKELDIYQERMNLLGSKLYAKRRSVIIMYEGWDTAGKSGNIKRMTDELDPRCYEVVPIGVPSADELSHHYLWRFMNKLPKDGHLTIYDRTWYGRVLVERVEKLTPEPVWRRAYKEINEIEAHINAHGTVIFKFWLQIDKDEQLSRLNARASDPLKQYKVTDEDWRNREKWDLYEEAVDEMLFETDTPHAPWTIIESNSKKYARLKTLRTVTETLEKLL